MYDSATSFKLFGSVKTDVDSQPSAGAGGPGSKKAGLSAGARCPAGAGCPAGEPNVVLIPELYGLMKCPSQLSFH